ncbi:hypothetical protein NVP1187O_251 [Vibrio phage 1.187.O._10N.286.49.F1]|nr:hypothetical protein NVP1187O_251 [Vibrio phage 1.187.O._10N.286.49.F1]
MDNIMKVSELILHLEEFVDTYGDLPVKLYTNHEGKHVTPSVAQLAASVNVEAEVSEGLHIDDCDDYPKVCELC